jgi:pSer/pThr/pTyr-binding forkhead associated (FHA) protein
MEPRLARLDVVSGKAAGMSIVVEDELLIGRHADGAGRLAEDEEISRSHARLTLDSAGFCAIEDLGSTNGTFVNGLRITSPHVLSEGDSIEMGGTTLVVRDLPTADSEPTQRVRRAPQRTLSRTDAPSSSAPEQEGQAAAVPAGADGATEGDDQTRVRGPIVSLQLEVDFEAGEAMVALDGGTTPLRLVFQDGAWRPVAPPD